MSDTDQQLLARYTRDRAEDAFAEVVRRHLDLVHSAALRQVRSPQLAEEVAQSVFTDLARNAPTLKPDTILTAWLYQVARRTAIDVVRREARRQLREQIATEMNAMNATTTDWTHIEPLLDEAVSALDETDRAAILLRYFENKPLREVGATLGTSDDAAQKRVSRAVERLREFFTKRGVTLGASGLVVVISANAVQAAPLGLAVTISTAAVLAGTAVSTSASVAATKTIAMTTIQKNLITATVAVLAGTGIYEARQASQLRDQVLTLQQQQQPRSFELDTLRNENQQLATLKVDADELERLRGERAELLQLRREVGQLRRQAAERSQPQSTGPPTGAAFPLAPTTEAEFQLAQRQVSTAMFRVGSALRQFTTNNPYGVLVDTNGQPNPEIFANFPGLPLDDLEIQARDVQSLAKAFDEKSKAILAVTKTPIFFNGYWTRFYLLADGSIRSDFSYSSDQQFKVVYPSDEDLDAMREAAQRDGKIPENLQVIRTVLEPVIKAFLAANNGHPPSDLTQLTPYAIMPDQQAALQTVLQMKQNSSSNNPAQ